MRIFLSYSGTDFAAADRIRTGLLERQPDLDIYFAPLRNEAGAYWISRLGAELAECDAVLLLLGERVGTWQELEYYEALRRNRNEGKPYIAPLLLGDSAPGLPFLDQFHRLSLSGHGFDGLLDLALLALEGTGTGEDLSPPWRLVNPYRGLLAMDTQDAAYFFGREALTADILECLAGSGGQILTLVGSSGVGKSSLARAGVLGALKSQLWPTDPGRSWPQALARSNAWPVMQLRPGEKPVLALARAAVRLWLESPADSETEALKWERLLMGDSGIDALLEALLEELADQANAEPPERVILYLDQGEELYSRSNQDQARRFSELVAAAANRPDTVIFSSLRADYYGRFQGDAVLFPASVRIDVNPLDRAGVERVIGLPAKRLGVGFEDPETAAHIATAAVREGGSLPLLSDLLADAWQAMARDSRNDGILRFPLTAIDISRPLADKAERFVAAHGADLDTLQRLFTLKLSFAPGEGDYVRRRARRSECDDREWQLVERLAQPDWRLVTTGEEAGEAVAEVAHEALLRHWPRAADWLEQSREFLVWRGQFQSEYATWEDADNADRPRALLTGLRLDMANRWLAQRGADLSPGEREFIEASDREAAAAIRREQEAAQRLARQRSLVQRISLLAAAVLTVVSVIALWQRSEARRAEALATVAERSARDALGDARRQANLADARRLATEAGTLLDTSIGETGLAGLLALESLRRSPTVEGKRVLRRVLDLLPARGRTLEAPTPGASLLYSPDGAITAWVYPRPGMEEEGGTRISLVETASGKPIAQIDHEGRNHRTVFSPDGKAAATLSGDEGELAIWELATGALRFRPGLTASEVAFTPDSRRIVAADYNRPARILDALSGQQIAELGEPGGVEAATLTRDGRTLVTFGRDGLFRGMDAITGEHRWEVDGERPDHFGVVLSADAQRYADLSADRRTVEVGSVRDGRVIARFPVGERARYALSGTGCRLLSWRAHLADPEIPGRTYSQVELWNVDSGELLWTRRIDIDALDGKALPGERFAILASRALKTDTDGFLEILAADTGKRLWSVVVPWGFVQLFPIDGDLVLVGLGASHQLRDLATGRIHFELDVGGVRAAALLPGRGLVVLGTHPGLHHDKDAIEIRELDSGKLRDRLDAPGIIRDIALPAGGKRLYVAMQDDVGHHIHVLSADTLERINVVRLDNAPVSVLPLDSEHFAVRDLGDTLRAWRAGTGEELYRVAHGLTTAGLHAATTADRAVTWEGSSLRLWDTRDGREIAHRRTAGDIERIAISPDGRMVVYTTAQNGSSSTTGPGFRRLVLWEPLGGEDPVVLSVERPDDMAFDATGRQLALRTGTEAVRVFEVTTLHNIARWPALPGGKVNRLAFSADGALLAVSESKGGRYGLRVFEVASGEEIARLDRTYATVMPGARALAERDGQGRWHSRDLNTAAADAAAWPVGSDQAWFNRAAGRLLVARGAAGAAPPSLQNRLSILPEVDGKAANALAASTDGAFLAAYSGAGISIHAANEAGVQALWPDVQLFGGGLSVGYHARPVLGGALAARGRALVAFDNRDYGTPGRRSRLWLWRWSTEAPRLMSEDTPINRVAISPDGAFFATAEGALFADANDRAVAVNDAAIRIWDVQTGAVTRRIAMHEVVDAVAFSPDGAHLAARTAAAVTVFDLSDGAVTARFDFPGQRAGAGTVGFALDGGRVVAEDVDGLRLWPLDGAPGALLRHGDWPRYAVDETGEIVATWSRTRVKVWDVASARPLFDHEFPDRYYTGFAFMGADAALMAQSRDGIRQLRWRTGQLIEAACQRIGRDIEAEEWGRFFGTGQPESICGDASARVD